MSITDSTAATGSKPVEGVPTPRSYRLIWFNELKPLRHLVPSTLASELDRAAAERLAKDGQACSFKFWPAPSQADQLGNALLVVRRGDWCKHCGRHHDPEHVPFSLCEAAQAEWRSCEDLVKIAFGAVA